MLCSNSYLTGPSAKALSRFKLPANDPAAEVKEGRFQDYFSSVELVFDLWCRHLLERQISQSAMTSNISTPMET